jgi:hypothetical protein
VTVRDLDRASGAGSPATRSPFARVACGVNGTRMAKQAVEQALEVAGEGTTIDFVAVTDARGAGPTLMAGTGVARALPVAASTRRPSSAAIPSRDAP